jgi:hypothetical protein
MVQIENRTMLVTLVQGIIRALNKDLRPLQNGRGEKTGERAEDHLLEKRGVHADLSSKRGAIAPERIHLK